MNILVNEAVLPIHCFTVSRQMALLHNARAKEAIRGSPVWAACPLLLDCYLAAYYATPRRTNV